MMHNFTYDLLGNGKKVIAHYNSDYSGKAIWTIVENDKRIVEVEADIEQVQHDVAFYDIYHPLPREERIGTEEIGIGGHMFPFAAILAIVEGLAMSRVTRLLEDQIYDMPIHELLNLEKVLENG